MREIFKQYAESICSGNPILNILESMKDICSKNGLFHEEGACVEKIWHITKEPKLYEEVGDIFQYKVRNRSVANAAYNKYIQYTNPEFYSKYAANLKALGFDCADTENSDDESFSEITDICDRYDLIVFMMLCLYENKDYDGILELIQYLAQMKSKILNYKDKYPSQPQSYIDEMSNTEKHLSEVLSETQNHNDINKFAVDLCKDNKKAYFNIVKDLITYKKYREAIDYYNDGLCSNLDYKQADNIISLCWIVSDFYRDIFDFYNAVFMQKIALEFELKEGKIDA